MKLNKCQTITVKLLSSSLIKIKENANMYRQKIMNN